MANDSNTTEFPTTQIPERKQCKYDADEPFIMSFQWAFLACVIILCIISFIGSVFTFMLMTSPRYSNRSFSVYFRFLAVSDLMCIMAMVAMELEFLLLEVLQIDVSYKWFDFYDQWIALVLCAEDVAKITSAWFLVAITTDRYITVLHPDKKAKMCTKGRAWRVCVFIALLAAAVQIAATFVFMHHENTDLDLEYETWQREEAFMEEYYDHDHHRYGGDYSTSTPPWYGHEYGERGHGDRRGGRHDENRDWYGEWDYDPYDRHDYDWPYDDYDGPQGGRDGHGGRREYDEREYRNHDRGRDDGERYEDYEWYMEHYRERGRHHEDDYGPDFGMFRRRNRTGPNRSHQQFEFECFYDMMIALTYFEDVTYVFMNMVLCLAIPLPIVGFMTTKIILKMRRMVKDAENDASVAAEELQRVRNASYGLAAVALISTLALSPVFLGEAVEILIQVVNPDLWNFSAKMEIMWQMFYLIRMVNYSFNFYVLVITGSMYREDMRKLLCRTGDMSREDCETGIDMTVVMTELEGRLPRGMRARGVHVMTRQISRIAMGRGKTLERANTCL